MLDKIFLIIQKLINDGIEQDQVTSFVLNMLSPCLTVPVRQPQQVLSEWFSQNPTDPGEHALVAHTEYPGLILLIGLTAMNILTRNHWDSNHNWLDLGISMVMLVHSRTGLALRL